MFFITASSVFHGLFCNNDNDNVENMKIEAISKSTFLEIARFVYSNRVNLTPDNMFDIYNCSIHFNMKFLTEKVIDYVCSQINRNNVLEILKNFDILRVKIKCFNFIETNPESLKSDFLRSVDSDLLLNILKTCKLNDETKLEIANIWSKSSKSREEELTEILNDLCLNSDCKKPSTKNTITWSINETELIKNNEESLRGAKNERDQKPGKSHRRGQRSEKSSNRDDFGLRKRDASRFRNRDLSRIRRRDNSGSSNTSNSSLSSRITNTVLIAGIKHLTNFKTSTFKFSTLKYLHLREIYFCYDFGENLESFKIWITTLMSDGRQNDLFYREVTLTKLIPYVRFKIPDNVTVKLHPHKNFSIKIEFGNHNYRTILKNLKIEVENNTKEVIKITDADDESNHIIEKIIFS